MMNGQNVWFELMTTDTNAAARFYAESVGWKPETWKQPDTGTPYTMWHAGKDTVGGMMAMPNVPPNWMAYTAVDNVDATATRVTELGGRVVRAPFDIPKGRMAVFADPQGAVFAVFKGTKNDTPSTRDAVGHFSWCELNTTNYQAGWTFYSKLFGWEHTESMDMGEGMGTYFMFKDKSGTTNGGMCNMATQMQAPPHWLHYIKVDDIHAAVARVQKMGGKVLNGPMPVPGGMIAQCLDPQGAAFAMHATTNASN